MACVLSGLMVTQSGDLSFYGWKITAQCRQYLAIFSCSVEDMMSGTRAETAQDQVDMLLQDMAGLDPSGELLQGQTAPWAQCGLG